MAQERAILPVIVGTAGHVHHGKSALVRLLTGCETMRLPEERARQLTIDLGFAPCRLADGRVLGIVDVPGHEDFLRNMVAGATAVDAVLLVVAATEGVMPQTAEHVRILRVLRRPPLLCVLTKTDLVDADRLAAARGEAAAFLARAGFPDAPIVACSSRSGDGLDAVWDGLAAIVAAAAARPRDARAFRLAVERSFQVAGHGTVVTGIPASGRAAPGDALEILPGGAASAVRGVQIYRRGDAAACAGTCVALNLRDAELAAVPRGAVVAAPGWYRAVSELVVALESVAEELSLPRLAEVRLHAGTAAVAARARLLDAESLPTGGSALVHLRLAEPVALAAGDRVLVRSLTPPATVGGGPVVCTAPPPLARRDAAALARVQAAAQAVLAGDPAGGEFLAGAEPVLPQAEAVRLIGRPAADPAAHPLLAPLGPGWWLVAPRQGEVAAMLAAAVDRRHAERPDDHGLPADAACAALGLPATAFAALAALAAGHGLAVVHGHLARAGRAPRLPARLAAARATLLERLVAGPQPRGGLPAVIGLGERETAQLLRLCGEAGDLRVAGNHVVAAPAWELWRAAALALIRQHGSLRLAEFRAATGLSRNLAVEFLDACDRDGFTRRSGDARVLARQGAA
jgi:selenocysteine-specific elongation factor